MSASTIDGLEGSGEGTFALWLRRGFLVLLTAVLVSALLGVMGDRTTRRTAISES